jgi:hypothetical protein
MPYRKRYRGDAKRKTGEIFSEEKSGRKKSWNPYSLNASTTAE